MANFTPHISFRPPFVSEQIEEDSDVEADLEVDQLDSDTDPEEQVDTAKASKAKNGSTRPGERVPGHTLLPAVRIENMLQADGRHAFHPITSYIIDIPSERYHKQSRYIEGRVVRPFHCHRMYIGSR